ncbi:periplasmic heavy metal sensor [Citreicella sp. C3M06]|uniref:periplasmic heavy metal sensor n=1 Tax=Citreicella sp. C3M06 TaxID=2841564 RepID=UPI0020907FB7|nr:periplasmic heavy metal sensor [Citreicella sp. C3M06]
MSKGMRALLFGSLALNVAVLGVGLGAVLLRPDDHRAPRGRDYAFAYTGAFSDQQRQDFGRKLRGTFDKRPERGGPPDMLANYHEALGLLRDDPFDPVAFGAAVGRQDQKAEARQALGREMMVAFIAELPPAERAAYADRLEARITDMAQRIRKHDGPRP